MSNNADGSTAQQCAYDPKPFTASETKVYACPCGMYGRYVRIRYPVDQTTQRQLCEVQVQAGGKYLKYEYELWRTWWSGQNSDQNWLKINVWHDGVNMRIFIFLITIKVNMVLLSFYTAFDCRRMHVLWKCCLNKIYLFSWNASHIHT